MGRQQSSYPTSYKLDEDTIDRIAAIAAAMGASKTDALRAAVTIAHAVYTTPAALRLRSPLAAAWAWADADAPNDGERLPAADGRPIWRDEANAHADRSARYLAIWRDEAANAELTLGAGPTRRTAYADGIRSAVMTDADISTGAITVHPIRENADS